MEQETNDLVIVGSGSTAFAAATRAKELGKTVAMTEARTLGGTCVNRGCLPSKNLIEAARLVFDAANPRYPGLAPAQLHIDFSSLIAQKDEVIREYRNQHYASILDEAENKGHPSIDIVQGHAAFVDPHTIEVKAPDGSSRWLTGDQILIATGSSPVIPDIPGLSGTPYLTSDLLTSQEAMELKALPRSLVIIGGGYIALELGQMFARFGSEVTILERSERILKEYEPEISRELTDILREEGLRIVTNATLRQVEGDTTQVQVTAVVHGQQRYFKAEKLLVATSRQPNTRNIGLEQIGVQLDAQNAVKVDSYLRTTVPHIWAAGDVIGRETDSQMATPVGAHDGGIAALNALTGANRRVDHRIIPRAIFTDPQVAVVGLTDEEANAHGIVCQCNTIPMSVVPRAGAIRDTRGVVKMVLERESRRVIGISMLGVNAGEVIHEAAMALRFGATADDFIDMIHVYPTMAEALKIVAISFTKDVNRLSCCAS
ncbi:MAG TPA: mercury(II) reductase [Ktedonobacteraceae bacterium]|nr:mercury(II) reductase [Ktedonobacteraceae bacterium]